MNAFGLKGPMRQWRTIVGFAAMLGIVLFSAFSVYGEEAGKRIVQKSAKTSVTDDVALQKIKKYDLTSIIDFALKNNPDMRNASKNMEIEQYETDIARANRMPRIDLGGGVTRFRYDTYLTPMVVKSSSGAGIDYPVYRRTIWDAGVSFKLPLFKGGRLYRAVTVAEMKKTVAHDTYRMTRQELIYNLTSVYCKIVQLEKLLDANDQSVRQLESHKRNVELFLETGAVPKLDLLKTDVELSHAIENRLTVKNNLAGTSELLKVLMGVDDVNTEITVVHEETTDWAYPDLEESMDRAFSGRPDYAAVRKKKLIMEERVKMAEGKRLPEISAAGEYTAKAGNQTSFKENWNYGVRFTIPFFDGGSIRAEIKKERAELEKVKEEERALKLLINQEVRNAHLYISNALERIEVAGKAIESAQENLKVETLKYNTGAGTSTDVIDAQTALLRAETDHYQALFDRETAFASLKKAIGEDEYDGEVAK
jgi:outer membrane protein